MLLFSTDIDGTIFDGPETAEIFAAFWKNLQEMPEPPLLVYNTGRSLDDVHGLLRDTALPGPDFIIAGVGTEMFDHGKGRVVEEWNETLSGDWDFETIHRLISSEIEDIEAQPDECQNEFKCSWFYHDKSREDLDRIAELIDSAGLEAQVVYSSNRDLDILPRQANKGNALRWLAGWKEIPLHRVAVAGDSGNDSSMFLVDDTFGVVVSNAEEALISAVAGGNAYLSEEPCARGVIEGLSRHLGLDTQSLSKGTSTSG